MQPSQPVRSLPSYQLTINQMLWIMAVMAISILWADSLSYAIPGQKSERTTLNDVTQGTLLFRSSTDGYLSPAPTLHTDVHISVTGLIARATVRQEFENPGAEWAEGIYVFPLPETAAVDHLRMRIGDRLIEGVIQERSQARKTYTKAKSEGKKASLIEQERPNIFTTSVANIGPHERISVEIEYQETVRFEDEQFSLRFPMVVGPRYIPGSHEPVDELLARPDGHGWAKNTNQVPDASRITPPVQHPQDGHINPLSLTINLAPGFPLARLISRYHAIHQTENEKDHYTIRLQESPTPADRDFELIWKPQTSHVPQATIFREEHGTHSYFLLLMTPPAPAFSDHITVSRDVTFVIDTSGSMHGTSIEQAKLALQLALTRLKAGDRFNIIQFNHETHAVFPSSQPVTSQSIRQAMQYITQLAAEGGTEMLPALHHALEVQEEHTNLQQIIFMTDGQVGNETALFKLIEQQLGHARLFTVGIGSAPNSYFMRHAAKFGRGTFTYIGHHREVQEKMSRLFQQLEHPVITNLELQLPIDVQPEIVPERIPDLYLGEPLMVAFRSNSPVQQARIKGKIGTRNWDTNLSLNDALPRQGLAVYWARQQITVLLDSHLNRQENPSIRAQVLKLAQAHHLVTRYTSLVAVDVTPSRPSDQGMPTHAMKTNLPHGQDYTKIFGLAAGATEGPWHRLVGLTLLLIGFTSLLWTRRLT